MPRKGFNQSIALRLAIIACLFALCLLVSGLFLAVFVRNVDYQVPGRTLPSAERIRLDGDWRVSYDDQMAFAQADFDDSAWQTVALPRNTAQSGSGPILWLRRQVLLSDLEARSFSGLTLGMIHAADAVYVNGVQIGSTGSLTDHQDINYDQIRVYRVPSGLLQAGSNTIAVRVRAFYPGLAGIYRGYLALGDYTEFTAEVVLHDIPLLIVAFLLIFSGVVYLAFHLLRSEQDQTYVLLSAFLFLMALYVLATTQIRFSLNLPYQASKMMLFSLLALLPALFLRFIYAIILAGDSGRCARALDQISRFYLLFPPLYIAANLIIGDLSVWRALDAGLNDNLVLASALLSLFVIIRQTVRRNRDALMLLAGTLLFAVSVTMDYIAALYGLNQPYAYASFGVAFLILSMNLVIISRIQRLNQHLAQSNLVISRHNQELESLVAAKTQTLVDVNRQLTDNNQALYELNEEMAKAQEQLAALASTDSLTGLYNRFEMDKRLNYEIDAMERYGQCIFECFAVASFDLDHFKLINDTFGHEAGDRVLILFAGMLRQATRSVDLVARYGGDEFVVLMPNTDLAGARLVADRIVGLVDAADSFLAEISRLKGHPVTLDGRRRLSCSYGLAAYDQGKSVDAIFREADRALYAMKETKRRHQAGLT
jgi:diguanylate cyclase (GGDEF)-like protein